jgi:sulfate transport system ATP-binding protein
MASKPVFPPSFPAASASAWHWPIEPRVLLLDEPFGALDAKVRKDLRRWLRELHDRTGHTTLFVTHDQEEAFELADRVAILNKGKIEQIGTPSQIVNHPATDFVAEFVDGIDLKRIGATGNGGATRQALKLKVVSSNLAHS